MAFAQSHAITDICILVNDLEASIHFYVSRLGFELVHKAPGFADFKGAGLTLAVWERSHIGRHAGVKAPPESRAAALIAVRLPHPRDVDSCYDELAAEGIIFVEPPADYPWNARCAYFYGPDGEVWELYAWRRGGAPGAVEAATQ